MHSNTSDTTASPSISREDLLRSIVSVGLLALTVVVFVYVVLSMFPIPRTTPPEYPEWVLFVNATEHYIGLFALASALFFQFGNRVPLPYTPSRIPPKRVPAALFLVGTVFSLLSTRLFLPQSRSLLFTELANLLVLFSLGGLIVYLMAKYAPPKK